MNGRIQDAVTGRFLSPDPAVQDPGFTQSYNRYSYVNNNPLTFVDPSGFDVDTVNNIVTVWGTSAGFGGGGGSGVGFAQSAGISPEALDQLVQQALDAGVPNANPPKQEAKPQAQPSCPKDNPDCLEPQKQQIPCVPGVQCYLQPKKPPSMLCKLVTGMANNHLAASFDLAGALGAGGALHVSVSPEGVNIFVGGGFGGGGEVGFTVGPAWEVNTPSRSGFRTFATVGIGDTVGGAATLQAGSNGVMASGGVGLVDGLLAETGYGYDLNIPLNLEGSLCP